MAWILFLMWGAWAGPSTDSGVNFPKTGEAFEGGARWCHAVEPSFRVHCHKAKPDDQPSQLCCQVCQYSKACGDGCVGVLDPCSKPSGCACNFLAIPRIPASERICCVTCWQGKACGDVCQPSEQACTAKPGCACDP